MCERALYVITRNVSLACQIYISIMVSNKLASIPQKETFDNDVEIQRLQDINIMIENVVSDAGKSQYNDICNDNVSDVKQCDYCNVDNEKKIVLIEQYEFLDNVL